MGLFNFKKKELVHRLNFSIAGMSYYVPDIIAIATPNEEYNYSDAQLVDLGRSKVYRYRFIIHSAKLVPEPKNKVDKNAVMVVVNGRRIGYVPQENAPIVKDMIKRPHRLSIELHGGEWRERWGDTYEKKNYTYYGEVTVELL